MAQANNPISNNFQISTVVLAFFAALLPIIGTSKFGIGLSPDSLSYFSAAKSLERGLGFIDSNGTTYSHWPPLLPLMLSGLGSFGLRQEHAMLALNSVAFAVIIYIWICILQKFVQDRLLPLIAATILIFSFACLKSAIMAWSESIYTLFLLCSLYQLLEYRTLHTKQPLILSSLFAGFACLTRYVGITWVVYAALIIAMAGRNPKEKLIDTLLFCGLSLSGLFVWIFRNLSIDGCSFGCRTPSSVSAANQVWPLITSLSRTIFPLSIADDLGAVLVCALIGLLVLNTIAILTGRIMSDRLKLRELYLISLIYVLLQLGFMVLVLTRIANEPISVRYLSPLLPFILFPIVTLIDQLGHLASTNKIFSVRYRYYGLALASIWAGATIFSAIELLQVWREQGAGDYSTSNWQNSEMLSDLRNRPISGAIYSDAADFLSYKTGVSAQNLPRRGSNLKLFAESLPHPAYGVWFSQSFRKYIITPDMLKEHASIVELRRFSDGIVYELWPKKQ